MRAVITFHSIDNSNEILSYTPAAFESLICGLQSSGIPIVSLNTLLEYPDKPGVCLTFDDGMQSLYTYVLPLMKRYHFPAHLFLTTSTIAGNNNWLTQPKNSYNYSMLNWDQIDELFQAGLSIEAHTHTHPWLTKLSKDEIHQECETANHQIERHLGCSPQYFAYPYGDYNQKVIEIVKQMYKASFTTQLCYLQQANTFSQLPRLDSYYLKHVWFHNHLDSLLSHF